MIVLTSGELHVKKVLKPTTAKFFKDLHEGDSIAIIHKIESTTGASNGLYSTQMKVINYTRNTFIYISENNLVARLANFEVFVP